jgi:hypothetical protein
MLLSGKHAMVKEIGIVLTDAIKRVDEIRLLVAHSQAEIGAATCDEWFDLVVQPGLEQPEGEIIEEFDFSLSSVNMVRALRHIRHMVLPHFDLDSFTLTERQTPMQLLYQMTLTHVTEQKTKSLAQSRDSVIEACIVHDDVELLKQLVSSGAKVQGQILKRAVSTRANCTASEWPAFAVAISACDSHNSTALFNQSLKSNNTAAWKIVFDVHRASHEELNQMLLLVVDGMLCCETTDALDHCQATAQFLLQYTPDVNKAYGNLKAHTSLLQYVVQTQAQSDLNRIRCLELLTDAGAWINPGASGIEWCRSFCKLMRGQTIAHEIITKLMQNSDIDLTTLSQDEAAQVLSESIRFRHFRFLSFALSILPLLLPKCILTAEEIQTLVQANETGIVKSLCVDLRKAPVLNWSKDEDCLAGLIDDGADVNKADSSGNKPLHLHSGAGTVSAVKLLLKHKADLNSKRPKDQNTALHVACQNDRKTVAELLIAAKADISTTNARGKVPLQLLSDRDYRAHLQNIASTALASSANQANQQQLKDKKARSQTQAARQRNDQVLRNVVSSSKKTKKSKKGAQKPVTPLNLMLQTEIDSLCDKASDIQECLVREALKKEVCGRLSVNTSTCDSFAGNVVSGLQS